MGENLTSLRLLRTMFNEYRLCGWHIVSSSLSNQRLIVDFKFNTNRNAPDRSLGPSTLFCMQIVKQLYTYLKIRQWTIVSGDRETETIHFSFTFEFKKDISRLPSSCLRRVARGQERKHWYDDDTLTQVMGIMRDLEQLDVRDELDGKSSIALKSSTSGAITSDQMDVRCDSLLLATPPMKTRMPWFGESESDSDPSDQHIQDELDNWRMGISLRSPPYGFPSSRTSLASTNSSSSLRSRSAIRRPIARRPVQTPFKPIAKPQECVPSPPNVLPEHGKVHGRSKSAVTPVRLSVREGITLETRASDRVEPCFLRRPVFGGQAFAARRKEGKDGLENESVRKEQSEQGTPDHQCSMCKKSANLDKQCENCKRRYCSECIWWCVISKRQRCLMCYSGG